MCRVYQPGEKSETYHRDDLRHEQSVHAGGRRGCECTRFSLSIDSCTEKIALTDSASPPVYALICGQYIFSNTIFLNLFVFCGKIFPSQKCAHLFYRRPEFCPCRAIEVVGKLNEVAQRKINAPRRGFVSLSTLQNMLYFSISIIILPQQTREALYMLFCLQEYTNPWRM